MSRHLDDLGAQVRQETTIDAPDRRWLQSRRSRYRRRRAMLAGGLGLVLVGGGLFAVFGRPTSVGRTEAVASTSQTEVDQTDNEQPAPTPATTTAPPPASNPAVAETTPTTSGARCGAWPTGWELWPDQVPDAPVDTIGPDGQTMRRQAIDGYTLEVVRPPDARVEYDLDYEINSESSFWSIQTDDTTHLGFDPLGQGRGQSFDEPTLELPGLEFLRLSDDDPALDALEGECAEFEFRLIEDGEVIDQVALGFASFGDPFEVEVLDGQVLTFSSGFDWIELGPIVVEQRSVDAVPGSVRCDGVLVDVDTTTYRVSDSVVETSTLGAAIAGGRFTEIADPLSQSAIVDPTELWAVLLPGADLDASLEELNQQGYLSYIDASFYEEFIDPETGPTSGPGVSGRHARAIDALQAFFDHPSAESFIKSGLVELQVDEATIAYGVPQGHGKNGWITVITVERSDEGWLVTGWTSAGC